MLTIYVNFNLLLAFFSHKLPTKYTQITHTHYWKNTPFTNLQYNAITFYITQLLTPHLQQHLTFLHTLTKLTYNIHINILKMYISFLISFIQHHIQRLKLFYTFVLCILLIFKKLYSNLLYKAFTTVYASLQHRHFVFHLHLLKIWTGYIRLTSVL